MSKRDTIIVAVLINIGLLGVLFMFAMNNEEDRITDQVDINYTLEETPTPSSQFQSTTVAASSNQTTPIDEVDDVLNSYNNTSPSTSSSSQQNGSEVEIEFSNPQQSSPVPASVPASAPAQKPVQKATTTNASTTTPRIIEVTVKKGDFLEKIAKANDSTVEDIKKLNNLTSERIDIGQVLKVSPNKKPVKAATTADTAKKTETKKVDAKEVASSDPSYYTIKSGDNPWKIARQFKVRYEDILRLNNLNEEKARNLKVGDKIRVK